MTRTALPLPLLLSLGVAGCGDSVPVEPPGNVVQTQGNASAPDMSALPVRIGELGSAFAACNAAGTTRRIVAGQTLAVKAAPFEGADEAGTIPAGSRFFVCTRSHDQKWFGVVWDETGTLSNRCRVSDPVTTRRPYEGPCKSGWVTSAFVKLVSGVDPGAPNQPALPNVSEGNAIAGADA